MHGTPRKGIGPSLCVGLFLCVAGASLHRLAAAEDAPPALLPTDAVAQAKKDPPELPPVKVPGKEEPGQPSEQPPEQPPQPPQQPQPTGPFGPGGVFNPNVQGSFRSLPDVEGVRINAGKKTENIDLRAQPPIANNNLRQALQTVPSLYISEETTPLISIGYRGLNPDRAQFMLILKDGIPIAADIFGYPESYYIPAFQTVDRIEFIHGGSSLQYGPQPGGALNFITKMPVRDELLQVYSENMFGSYNFFSTYESISGTNGPFGYYAYGHHRESRGFRLFNSEYEVNYGGAKAVIDVAKNARFIFAADLYSEGHGEPGGLLGQTFEANPRIATRQFDYFQLRRYAATVAYQEALSDDTFFEIKGWGVYYSRWSRRQRGGGFGTVPTGADSDFQLQEFYNFGVEPRYRCDYCLFGDENKSTFACGIMYYHTDSPRQDLRGPNQANYGNILRNQSDRQTDYVPVFAENLFRLGNWLITPGIRLENIWQGVQQNVDVDRTAAGRPLADDHVPENVLLLGLGIAYKFTPKIEAYHNISQGYRPILFAEAVVPGANQVVAGNLQPGSSYQADIGCRGNPNDWLSWDTSLFYMEFNDQIGTLTRPGLPDLIANVGDAFYRGWEAVVRVDLSGMIDDCYNTDLVDNFGSFGPFYNMTLLHARFFEGPANGKAPAYAPDYLMKVGITYSLKDPVVCPADGQDGAAPASGGYGSGSYGGRERLRIWFTGTFAGDAFGDDNNTAQRVIPSYKVWDLTGEARIYKNYLRLFGGIYNIFDERYFSRVTSTGIDPAYPRNFYAGLRIVW